jgi:lathosterol oxidase
MTPEMQPKNSKQFRIGEGRISGYLSLFLGVLSLFAVVCFLFPEFFYHT